MVYVSVRHKHWEGCKAVFHISSARPRLPLAIVAQGAIVAGLLVACGGEAAPVSSSAAPASSAAAKPSAAAASTAAAKPSVAGSGAASGVASPAGAPISDADWANVQAAAKKEGQVILWGNAGAARKAFWKDAFEKQNPGITVDFFEAATSSERDQRYIKEYQAGVAKVDVLAGGSAGSNASVKPLGMLQDVHPFLRAQILDPKNWLGDQVLWVDKEQKYMLQADTGILPIVTNKSLSPDIKGWNDLLDPRLKGKIVMTDPRQSGGGFATGLFMYHVLGPEFTQKFYQNNITFSADEDQNMNWVNSGKMMVNVGTTPATIQSLLKTVGDAAKFTVHSDLEGADGKPIMGYAGYDGIAFMPNLNPLPHPNATKVWINWMYSKEGQQALVDFDNQPSHRVDVDMSKLPSWAVPKSGVQYSNLNDEKFTAGSAVKAMRDDVSKWAQK